MRLTGNPTPERAGFVAGQQDWHGRLRGVGVAAIGSTAEKRQRFGATLRRHLKLWGLSQSALAERVGTTQSAVSAWASGKSMPSPDRVFELERIFELSPGTLASLL